MIDDRRARPGFMCPFVGALAHCLTVALSLGVAVAASADTTVAIRGEDFLINGRPTYEGRLWQGHRVEGLLMNNRVVQGTFDDLNPETVPRWVYPDTGKWDPERNNREFLAAMPDWKAHGILSFTVNFEGGSPEGYSKRQPWENHPFNADGSLRPEFTARMKRILDEADRLGMAPIVGYFYFGQSGRLKTDENVVRATDTLTHWLLAGGWRNLLVEVNNETNPAYNPPILRPGRVHELIARVRETKSADGRRLLVGTSFPVTVMPTVAAVRASDFVLLHGNSLPSSEKLVARIRATRALDPSRAIPVLVNEDDHNDFDSADGRLASCVAEHVSWGWFDWRRPGESFDEGYQSVPVNWGMSSARKRNFFAKVAEITHAPPLAAASPPPVRPNILFILTDDQRWNALGCMGDRNIETPNIDHLAKEGVLFQNHFVTTSICCCSRASIFTGQYMRRHGIPDFSKPFTADQWAQTYPALLRKNGYRTGFIGKFGVGNDPSVNAMGINFDTWQGIPGQGGRYFIDPNDRSRTHQTSRMGDQALEFLGANRAGQPFCLSISFTAPHARDHMPREYTPDDRDETMYDSVTLPTPPTASDAYFQLLPKSVQNSEGRTRWHWRFDTPGKFQANVKDYYRLISGIDREVGRVMAELRTRGLAENTVVIFTSDNGYFLGDRGLAGKWLMYEESLRDPLIIFDPREPAANRGRNEDSMTLNIDFAETMLDLAGIAPPVGMQGRSLIPLVKNQHPADWRHEFFYEHHFSPDIIPPSEGVRTERFSYIRWINEDPLIEELYDLKTDTLEGHSLARDPAYAQTLAELRTKWDRYRTDLQ